MSSTEIEAELNNLKQKVIKLIMGASAEIRNLDVCIDRNPDGGKLTITITGKTRAFYQKQRAQEAVFSCPDLDHILFDFENKIVVVRFQRSP